MTAPDGFIQRSTVTIEVKTLGKVGGNLAPQIVHAIRIDDKPIKFAKASLVYAAGEPTRCIVEFFPGDAEIVEVPR